MELREAIRKILSIKKAREGGLHVKYIARHILNEQSDLFSTGETTEFEEFKRKVNVLLLRESKKKKGEFKRVKNKKTKKFRKGVYMLRLTKSPKNGKEISSIPETSKSTHDHTVNYVLQSLFSNVES